MKEIRYLSYILVIFTTQINNREIIAKDCDLIKFRYIERKVFCETENGVTTSCLGAPFPVKRAYIQCSNKYHNFKNISSLTIDCQDNGEWTDEIFDCLPECDDTNISFKILNNTNEEYPPWYAEVIHLDVLGNVKQIYPGIILAERYVFAELDYNLKKVSHVNNYRIRIPRLKYKQPKEYKIRYWNDGTHSDSLYVSFLNKTEDELIEIASLMHVDRLDYIKFDDVTLPACDEINPPKAKGTLKLLDFKKRLKHIWFSERYFPLYEKNCFLPKLDNTKMEAACFKTSGEPTECIRRADWIVTRCRIGYQQRNTPLGDFIAQCESLNSWDYYFGEDNDCDLVCGEIDKNYRPRQRTLIHGGSETHNGFAPWHVAVYFNDTRRRTIKQICGGSIIHSNIVLSAAHCFYNIGAGKLNDASNYLIAAGKYYRKYETSEESEHYAKIEEIHIPENFEAFPLRNDIAVLELDHHIEFSSVIKPICIDFSSTQIPSNLNGYFVGWGATSMDDEQSNELLSANLTTLTNEKCKVEVGPRDKSDITPEKFCAINDKRSAACQGDSGGGYVVKKYTGFRDRYFLLGIISLGLGANNYCSDGFTTVFTNVLLYKTFIENVTSNARSLKFIRKYANNNMRYEL
ncbi:uncharacterized protein LOC129609277 [Condylostylus longicornis]|uniref:uncharacterized protein LOC129609277 n=1 Tax=Condylostylus longicornis TaxID=2530218 RepID=UPI00244E5388|nr:uncharacterized protein LOC129609277 [Condylostylus longicornis]